MVERFDADPDPTFHADADPNFFSRREKNFLKIRNYFFKNLTKLVMCNFLSNNSGGREGWWVSWVQIWIWIRQNDVDHSDPDLDPQHCYMYTIQYKTIAWHRRYQLDSGKVH